MYTSLASLIDAKRHKIEVEDYKEQAQWGERDQIKKKGEL